MANHRLTPKQQRFVAEYLVDLNATQAARRAGYSARSANEQGARLLANASVAAAVAQGKRRQLQQAELSAARVLEELRRVAFLDPARFYYPPGHERAGQLMPIAEMDEDVRACIASQKVARANQVADGKRNAEWLHELKVHDKLKALEMLGKHLGLFKAVVDVTTDWEELAARLASARTERVDPRQFLAGVAGART